MPGEHRYEAQVGIEREIETDMRNDIGHPEKDNFLPAVKKGYVGKDEGKKHESAYRYEQKP